MQQEQQNAMRQSSAIQSLLARLDNQNKQPEPEPTESLLDKLPEDERNATRQIIAEATRGLQEKVDNLSQVAEEVRSDKRDLNNETYVRKAFGNDWDKLPHRS